MKVVWTLQLSSQGLGVHKPHLNTHSFREMGAVASLLAFGVNVLHTHPKTCVCQVFESDCHGCRLLHKLETVAY